MKWLMWTEAQVFFHWRGVHPLQGWLPTQQSSEDHEAHEATLDKQNRRATSQNLATTFTLY